MTETSVKKLDIKELLDAGLHFGHQTKRWNPRMKRYIHGAKNGIYIIDLNKTLSQLELAKTFLKDTVLHGDKVRLFETPVTYEIDNELDIKVKKLEQRVAFLEKLSEHLDLHLRIEKLEKKNKRRKNA